MTKKACPKCQKTLPVSEFDFRDKARTKIQSYCKGCANTAWREWYSQPRNKQHHLATLAKRRARRIERNRAIIRHLKGAPCTDCGLTFPPEAMDFDHLENKDELISKLVFSVGTKRLLAEISKCEVVCANCHRVRTQQRMIKSMQ